MDRERKLLYVVAILAVVENALLVPTYQSRADLFKIQTDAESTRKCEARLIHIFNTCLPALHPMPRSGFSKHE